ncbi:MAG: hypothetical protein HYV07_03390 [Deltaproteobacteria bacterium]|nr:hypothetical protein [Deltaproteobacteria bacterium]
MSAYPIQDLVILALVAFSTRVVLKKVGVLPLRRRPPPVVLGPRLKRALAASRSTTDDCDRCG